jgi:two-component system nitrogen regulation response regulator GlnG
VPKLLVVDDEQSICWGIRRLGESIGHAVFTASSAEQAIELADQERPDVVVLDVRLPGMDGLTALGQLRERIGQAPVIVITAYGDLQTAVEAVRRGAFEYLCKPFSLEQMERVLARAVESLSQDAAKPAANGVLQGLVGKSAGMQEVFKRVALAAASDASVLLYGESGTGKELAARAVHRFSARSSAPFVAVNVAALSPTLAESELFGHVRGSFTGAHENRTGVLVQANGGTLFLDEVADIPLPLQVKLLRVLDLGEVSPVGSSQTVRTDFRVISATHQNLEQRVRDGTFRHDLYFRLRGFQIDMPPLREREDDIALLSQHFLESMGARATMPPAVLVELRRRPWYGNVRELRHAIEHAAILARGGPILPEHLPAPAVRSLLPSESSSESREESIAELLREWAEAKLREPAPPGGLYEQFLGLVEPPLLRAALAANKEAFAPAAQSLGLHRTTLRKKADQYGLSEPT